MKKFTIPIFIIVLSVSFLLFFSCDESIETAAIIAPEMFSLVSLSTTDSSISFTWTDPEADDFNYIMYNVSSDTDTFSGTISAGEESFVISDLAGYYYIYTITFNTVDTAGYKSADYTLYISPSLDGETDEYSIITTADELLNISSNPDGAYLLAKDINLDNVEWTPICYSSDPTALVFSGSFSGNGHTISNLKIDKDIDEHYKGLFSYSTGHIYGLNLTDVNLNVGCGSGCLTGWNMGVITDCKVSGSVEGQIDIGGLTGYNEGLIIRCSSDTAVISKAQCGGGLVGNNPGKIYRSFSTGNVEGLIQVGGLVGLCDSDISEITACYATGNVSGDTDTGGLAGLVSAGTVTDSYAMGAVEGITNTGGLIGTNVSIDVSNCYSTGFVSGSAFIGGLVGQNTGIVTACFYDAQTSGYIDAGGSGNSWTDIGMSMITILMQDETNFIAEGWDFTEKWDSNSDINNGYPYLIQLLDSY